MQASSVIVNSEEIETRVETRKIYLKLTPAVTKKLNEGSSITIRNDNRRTVDDSDSNIVVEMNSDNYILYNSEIESKKKFSLTNDMVIHVGCSDKIINRGTGAGGRNTTKNGAEFEQLTFDGQRLVDQGFKEITESEILPNGNIQILSYWLKLEDNGNKIYQSEQCEFIKLINTKFSNRLTPLQEGKIQYKIKPDEFRIIVYPDGRTSELFILEKKTQNKPGSVIVKLKAGLYIKRDYEKMFGINFRIHYAFCVNKFLKDCLSKNPEFNNFVDINAQDDIIVIFGDENNYGDDHDEWISCRTICL